MFLTQKTAGSRSFSDPMLWDYIASHTLMEIHGRILVLLVQILKDVFLIWAVSLIISSVASSPVKSKASLGKDK